MLPYLYGFICIGLLISILVLLVLLYKGTQKFTCKPKQSSTPTSDIIEYDITPQPKFGIAYDYNHLGSWGPTDWDSDVLIVPWANNDIDQIKATGLFDYIKMYQCDLYGKLPGDGLHSIKYYAQTCYNGETANGTDNCLGIYVLNEPNLIKEDGDVQVSKPVLLSALQAQIEATGSSFPIYIALSKADNISDYVSYIMTNLSADEKLNFTGFTVNIYPYYDGDGNPIEDLTAQQMFKNFKDQATEAKDAVETAGVGSSQERSGNEEGNGTFCGISETGIPSSVYGYDISYQYFKKLYDMQMGSNPLYTADYQVGITYFQWKNKMGYDPSKPADVPPPITEQSFGIYDSSKLSCHDLCNLGSGGCSNGYCFWNRIDQQLTVWVFNEEKQTITDTIESNGTLCITNNDIETNVPIVGEGDNATGQQINIFKPGEADPNLYVAQYTRLEIYQDAGKGTGGDVSIIGKCQGTDGIGCQSPTNNTDTTCGGGDSCATSGENFNRQNVCERCKDTCQAVSDGPYTAPHIAYNYGMKISANSFGGGFYRGASCYGEVSSGDSFQPSNCGNVWGPVCTEDEVAANFNTPEALTCTSVFASGPKTCDGTNPEILSGGWNDLQIEILPGRAESGNLATYDPTLSSGTCNADYSLPINDGSTSIPPDDGDTSAAPPDEDCTLPGMDPYNNESRPCCSDVPSDYCEEYVIQDPNFKSPGSYDSSLGACLTTNDSWQCVPEYLLPTSSSIPGASSSNPRMSSSIPGASSSIPGASSSIPGASSSIPGASSSQKKTSSSSLPPSSSVYENACRGNFNPDIWNCSLLDLPDGDFDSCNDTYIYRATDREYANCVVMGKDKDKCRSEGYNPAPDNEGLDFIPCTPTDILSSSSNPRMSSSNPRMSSSNPSSGNDCSFTHYKDTTSDPQNIQLCSEVEDLPSDNVPANAVILDTDINSNASEMQTTLNNGENPLDGYYIWNTIFTGNSWGWDYDDYGNKGADAYSDNSNPNMIDVAGTGSYHVCRIGSCSGGGGGGGSSVPPNVVASSSLPGVVASSSAIFSGSIASSSYSVSEVPYTGSSSLPGASSSTNFSRQPWVCRDSFSVSDIYNEIGTVIIPSGGGCLSWINRGTEPYYIYYRIQTGPVPLNGNSDQLTNDSDWQKAGGGDSNYNIFRELRSGQNATLCFENQNYYPPGRMTFGQFSSDALSTVESGGNINGPDTSGVYGELLEFNTPGAFDVSMGIDQYLDVDKRIYNRSPLASDTVNQYCRDTVLTVTDALGSDHSGTRSDLVLTNMSFQSCNYFTRRDNIEYDGTRVTPSTCSNYSSDMQGGSIVSGQIGTKPSGYDDDKVYFHGTKEAELINKDLDWGCYDCRSEPYLEGTAPDFCQCPQNPVATSPYVTLYGPDPIGTNNTTFYIWPEGGDAVNPEPTSSIVNKHVVFEYSFD